MAKHTCCIPQCSTNYKNKTAEIHFHRIPFDAKLRDQYKIILRNKNLKIESDNTRICSKHWEGGQKLSRNHLPTIFPWAVPRKIVLQNENLEKESIKIAAIYSEHRHEESGIERPNVSRFPKAKPTTFPWTVSENETKKKRNSETEEDLVVYTRKRQKKLERVESEVVNAEWLSSEHRPNEREPETDKNRLAKLKPQSIDFEFELHKATKTNPSITAELKNVRLEKIIFRLKQNCEEKY